MELKSISDAVAFEYRDVEDLIQFVKKNVSYLIATQLHRAPRITTNREEHYTVATALVFSARKRLLIIERTPVILLGPGPYYYEEEFHNAVANWCEYVADEERRSTAQRVEASTEIRSSQRKYMTGLRQILTTRFDEGELRTLCFDLELDYDKLPGSGKANIARELISYLNRRERMHELIEVGKQLRPDIDWEGVPETREALITPPRSDCSHIQCRLLFCTPDTTEEIMSEDKAELFKDRLRYYKELEKKSEGRLAISSLPQYYGSFIVADNSCAIWFKGKNKSISIEYQNNHQLTEVIAEVHHRLLGDKTKSYEEILQEIGI